MLPKGSLCPRRGNFGNIFNRKNETVGGRTAKSLWFPTFYIRIRPAGTSYGPGQNSYLRPPHRKAFFLPCHGHFPQNRQKIAYGFPVHRKCWSLRTLAGYHPFPKATPNPPACPRMRHRNYRGKFVRFPWRKCHEKVLKDTKPRKPLEHAISTDPSLMPRNQFFPKNRIPIAKKIPIAHEVVAKIIPAEHFLFGKYFPFPSLLPNK